MAQKQVKRIYHQGELPLVLSPQDAARLLPISTEAVRRLCNRGEIEAWYAGKAWCINTASLLAKLGIPYTGKVTKAEIYNTLLHMRQDERQDIVEFARSLENNKVYQIDNRGEQFVE